ncbi:oligosaccharide flippase family protein [Novosphingobium soli]|uniref:Oligosaccharide flippase family protein n=1 Tax=Novosphingobium soli TaxID=574956 RepID=A0ABV6CWX1_9SPHN
MTAAGDATGTAAIGRRGTGSVKSAALWAASSQYSLFALQFVTSVIISRFFLRPDEIGLFSVALAAAMVLSIIQDFGLHRYIGRHPTADRTVVRSCTAVALVLAAVLAATVFALARPLAWAYDEPRIEPILHLLAVSYCFVPWSVVPIALLARRLDFRRTFAVNFSGAVANSGVALTLSWLGYSSFALAWGTVAQAVVRALVAQIAQPTPPGRGIDRAEVRAILRFSAAATPIYLSGGIGVRTPDMVVGGLQGMTAAGLFSRGAALAAQLHTLVVGAVSAIYFPAFARLRDQCEPLGPSYERVLAAHGAIVWPAMALLAVLSQPVILLLYGPLWVDAAPLLAFVALAECCFVALPLHMDLPILLGRMRRLFWFNIVDTAISVATLAAGAAIGLEAAAGSRIVYGLCWFGLYAAWLQRLIGFSWRAALRIYARSGLLAFATAAPALLAVTHWRTPGTLGLAELAATGAACALAWVGGLFLLHHPARADIADMAAHVAGALPTRNTGGEP